MGIERGILKAIDDHKEKIQGPHFIFSAENPKFPHLNQIGLNHDQVLHHLKGAGYDAHEVHGHYGAPEKSIAVYGVSPKHAENLHAMASKLGQDSSIYSTGKKHEMRFHHGKDAGKKILGEGTSWHKQKPKDFFTSLPGGVHHFTHNFNFGKSEEIEKSNYGPGRYDLYNHSDNARRKADRTGEQLGGIGPNKAVKNAGVSLKQQADIEAKESKQKSKQNPVKIYSTAEKKKLERQMKRNKKLSKSSEEGRVKLIHYSNQPNLSVIDPKFKGSGMANKKRDMNSEHPHSFYYKEGSPQEEYVVNSAAHKYHTSTDSKKIYDAGKDPHGFVEKIKTANNGALNMDILHSKIKEHGYHGFENSNHPIYPGVVLMYHPLKVEHHEPLR